MVLLLPSGLAAAKKGKQAAAMQFSARSFDEKGTAAAWPDE
jgi:hypothetical protein